MDVVYSKDYNHNAQFETQDFLTNFLNKTENKEKMHVICVLFGNNDKTSKIINRLIEKIKIKENIMFNNIESIKTPKFFHNKQLVIIDNPAYYEFDTCIPHIKEYLGEDVIYVRPYKISTTANIIIKTEDISFLKYFSDATLRRFKIVKCD